MMTLGYIKNGDDMDIDKLTSIKKSRIFSSLPMIGIGIIYTLELLGIW